MRFTTPYGTGRIWVEIEDDPAKEYNVVRDDKNPLMSTTSCYIEAKPGKTFTVCYCFPSNMSKALPTEISLKVDGKLIDTDVSGCDMIRAKVEGEFHGYRQEDSIHKSTYKAFSFALPKLTDADMMGEAGEYGRECSIEVVIGWRRVQGNVNHKHINKKRYVEEFAKKVNKDTKTAIVGVHTVPGKIVETEPTYICYCPFAKPKNTRDYSFIFRYRRRRWLESEGHIQPDSDVEEEDPGFYMKQCNIVNRARSGASIRAVTSSISTSDTPSEEEVKREIKTEPPDSLDSDYVRGPTNEQFFFDFTEND